MREAAAPWVPLAWVLGGTVAGLILQFGLLLPLQQNA